MNELVNKLRATIQKLHRGGGEQVIERHTSKGKLFVRERINLLLDPGSPFLELSPLAAYEMYQPDNVAAAGIITGIGQICGWVILKHSVIYFLICYN